MPTSHLLNFIFSPWALIPFVFFCWVIVLVIIKVIVFKAIQRFAGKTSTRMDDIFVQAANFPLTLIIIGSGAAIIGRMIPSVDGTVPALLLIAFKALTIVALILFADRFINALIDEYSNKIDVLKTSKGVAQAFVRFIVFGIGLLVLLDSFGVSITPIIASLGIGSLAVALALQPTLENLFSGIQIVADKPFLEGQFIKLDSGEEGYVDKIGWRSTWVRLPHNNVVVIPNKTLVNSQILNYYYPDKEVVLPIEVGVHYQSDLDYVEKVIIDVARKVLNDLPQGVKNFEPLVRFHTFADFSINATVVLRVNEVTDRGLVKHEFIKRLHKRFNQEGIIIPYPIEAVNFAQERAFDKEGRATRKYEEN